MIAPAKKLLLFVAAATIAAGVSGCSSRANISDAVEGAAERAVREDSRLDLRAVTEKRWDRLFVFDAYTPPDVIDRRLGFRWEDSEKDKNSANDGNLLMVFTDDRAVVATAMPTRSVVEFQCLASGGPYSHDEAVFDLVKRSGLYFAKRGTAKKCLPTSSS